jgi:DNA-binding MarR family transcriptional regulator
LVFVLDCKLEREIFMKTRQLESLDSKLNLKLREPRATNWTFLSNHTHVLILLAKEPEILLRDVADLVGITERAVQKIVADLEKSGFFKKEKIGRCNRYNINTKIPLRHPLEAHKQIGELLSIFI